MCYDFLTSLFEILFKLWGIIPREKMTRSPQRDPKPLRFDRVYSL